MNLTELIKSLSNADNISYVTDAVTVAGKELIKNCEIKNFNDGSLAAFINKGKEKTALFDAHIDQIGMIVTKVNDNGFLKVSNVGGIDERLLAATPVNVYGKRKITGVFCSTPPHLVKADQEKSVKKITEMAIDTGLSDANLIVSEGDVVTYSVTATELKNGIVTGKSLDNRAGVAALIRAVELISQSDDTNYNVIILLSIGEELGLRGAKLKAFDMNIDFAVAVDVSFGNCPGVSSDKTAKLGSGAMIGVSPVLSSEITKKLITAAKVNDINYTLEVMGGNTSTNADELSLVKSGIPCGLVSIPLRNMHTPVEVVDVNDVESTARILAAFVKE